MADQPTEHEEPDSLSGTVKLEEGLQKEDGRHDEHGRTHDEKLQRRLAFTGEEAPFDISYHPGRIMLYSHIRQRQKWGDTQVLPRVNWGDLFFDLFYVGATYNVSYILVENPSSTGLLYAAGSFLPLVIMWVEKMVFDARFVHEDDLFHRFFQLAGLAVLAIAVLHIRPVAILSDSSEISMLTFALCLVLERLLIMTRLVEIYFYGVGQRQVLQTLAKRELQENLVPLLFFLVSFILAVAQYVNGTSPNVPIKRNLAATAENSYVNESSSNIPIWLCLFGYVTLQVMRCIKIMLLFPGQGRHKEIAEFTMLMLGESILSLLIIYVPDENGNFYTTFFGGVLTVILLQYLHFRSQPHDPKWHAMRRHKNAGISWSVLNQIYSFAFVILGAAFTSFLTASSDNNIGSQLVASAESPDTKKPTAHLFSGSLGVIFACLDIMTVLHLGLKESHDRCVCEQTKRKNVKGIFLVFIRFGVIVFIATLSQWESEPETLTLAAVACVLFQLLMRKLGGKYLSHSQVHVLDPQRISKTNVMEHSASHLTTARSGN